MNLKLSALIYIISSIGLYADYQTLETAVNDEWVDKDYAGVLSLINDELSNDADDPLALGLKVQYYIYCELDLSQARAAALSYKNAIQAFGDDVSISYATNLYDRIMKIPLSESIPLTQSQHDALHQIYSTKFPEIEILVARAKASDPE